MISGKNQTEYDATLHFCNAFQLRTSINITNVNEFDLTKLLALFKVGNF